MEYARVAAGFLQGSEPGVATFQPKCLFLPFYLFTRRHETAKLNCQNSSMVNEFVFSSSFFLDWRPLWFRGEEERKWGRNVLFKFLLFFFFFFLLLSLAFGASLTKSSSFTALSSAFRALTVGGKRKKEKGVGRQWTNGEINLLRLVSCLLGAFA